MAQASSSDMTAPMQADTVRDWRYRKLDDHGRNAYFEVWSHMFAGVKHQEPSATPHMVLPTSLVCFLFVLFLRGVSL
jgi:hypothetical protein